MSTPFTTAEDVRVTEFHRYPLPPRLPNRYQPKFDGYGRYKMLNPSTGKVRGWTRATTLAKTLDDTFNLDRWKRRQLMRGLVSNPEMITRLDAIMAGGLNVDSQLNDLAEEAQVAAGSAEAREFGEAVHAWLEAGDRWAVLPAQVPEMYRPHVDAYNNRLAAHALWPVPEYTERIVMNSHAESVGTIDRIFYCADGSLVMGDVKTSKSLDYSWLTYVVQLLIYADADLMMSEDGTRWEPMPEIRKDFAVLMHCPSDAPENTAAVTFDLNFGRTALDAALLVRQLRKDAPKRVPNQHAVPIPDQATARRHAAILAIKNSRSSSELSEVWSQYQDIWTDDLTNLGGLVVQSINAESAGS